MPVELTVSVSDTERVTALVYRAVDAKRIDATLVLAHGAGAGHLSPFITRFASGLASRGIGVLTFNFLYTEQRRRLPDRTEKLEACYRAVIASARGDTALSRNTVFIGGKSMGGRIASQVAAGEHAESVSGLIFLGYPLHPPGKPDRLRAAHLSMIRAPMLFIQGSRDPFGTPDELRPVLDGLSTGVTLHVVEHGDHSLAPPKKGGRPVAEVYDELQDVIAEWIRERCA